MAERPSVHVTFFMHPVENKRLSVEAGRPIFKDVEYVRIKFPGDPKRIHVAPAKEKAQMEPGSGRRLDYIERFPEHYARFKAGNDQGQVGTPISELPFLTEAKRHELRAVSIHTAEALAELPDRTIQKLGMGMRSLVEQARSWLDAAAGSAATTALAAENEELRQRMERLEEMLKQSAAPPPAEEPPAKGDNFADWKDPDIKAFLKDVTGALPQGNPKHDTLVRLAEQAVAAKKAA